MESFFQGDIISYPELCLFEGFSVQQGMNFESGRGGSSVLLMSTSSNSPYDDQVLENGRIVIYEGHDIRRDHAYEEDPKNLDQPLTLPSGNLTANGKFHKAAKLKTKPCLRLYEKLKPGIWVYSGKFRLADCYTELVRSRRVVKLRLEIVDYSKQDDNRDTGRALEHARMIPSRIKFEVYKRDDGACVECGAKVNLHYDHILPYSKGGLSDDANNIQILCAKHNLYKSDKIM
jgi:hypothetical protein